MEEKELQEITGKIHGAEGEGEQISVVLQEFNWENVLKSRDIKLICAASAFLNRKWKYNNHDYYLVS